MNFYIIEPDGMLFGYKWAYFEQQKPSHDGKAERCHKCNSYVSSLKWLSPHYISISQSKTLHWGDFLWGTHFFPFVSSRFLELYRKEKLKGISAFYPSAMIKKFGTKKT